jgi:hypothetical protein
MDYAKRDRHEAAPGFADEATWFKRGLIDG